ncbi:hypothetical protein [Motilimonas sp. 1_MG-2023]|uniref:hypothetical protein n=1 Tax=Motilimonas TaxID=1914248 RepID=UPI0026E27516|nr:hypothetical protein [Motilimonas sp. 1_MG-2023]MDO6528174.1 hypothetical protein [Motilimonas sp. 1_MG-2023]
MNISNDNINNFNVKVNEVGFGKPISEDESINFELLIDFKSILEKFSEYFNDFVERESEDPEPDEYLNGVYLELKHAGYPRLERIIDEHLNLFCKLVSRELSSEFLGYLLTTNERTEEKSLFVIQSLNNLEPVDGKILCEGVGYLISKLE